MTDALAWIAVIAAIVYLGAIGTAIEAAIRDVARAIRERRRE